MLIYVGYSASTGVNQIKTSGKPYANIRSTQQLYKGHRYIENFETQLILWIGFTRSKLSTKV